MPELRYDTKLLPASLPAYEEAARLLRQGEVVAIPTETVYGLACSAYDPVAVAKVFHAKGRPQDNPLIVHIADLSMLPAVAAVIPDTAMALAKRFWPGPLTIIFEKTDAVPDAVSAGLHTVAVRMPNHPAAVAVIREAGLPLAAPSANLSGKPSPTKASHVFDDLYGRIPLVIDGGASEFGVESTVIAVEGERVRLLRPGAVTAEDLRSVAAEVVIDEAVLSPLAEGQQVRSPGTKYKHYSPDAHVMIVDAALSDYIDYVERYAIAHPKVRVFGLVFDEDIPSVEGLFPYLAYGSSSKDQAKDLFECLRELDKLGAETVFARSPGLDGIGLAVYNRLLRAAGFEVITVEHRDGSKGDRPDRPDRRGENDSLPRV